MTTIPLGPSPAVRAAAVRRGRLLNRLTIGWNAIEGIVAVAAGLAAGSVSLVGFGLDSAIEVSAAVILAWRLAQERGEGCTQAADRRATRAIAVSFFALAAYVGVESTRDLFGRAEPEASIPGIFLAGLSLGGGVGGQPDLAVRLVVGGAAGGAGRQRRPRLVVGRPGRRPRHRRPGRRRRHADLAGRVPGRHLLRLASVPSAPPQMPTRAKLAILVAGLWLLSPIDLLPEFLPVIGPPPGQPAARPWK
jgi:hypothetical protein